MYVVPQSFYIMVNRQEESATPSIVFVSSLLPPHRFVSIKNNSKGPMSNANSNFQLSILDGFIENAVSQNELFIINYPNIGAYPFRYKKIWYHGKISKYKSLQIHDIGFINLPHIKHVFKKISLIKKLSHFIKQQTVPPIIIIYDLDKAFVNAINSLKERGLNFLAICIVPDLPGMTGNVDHWAYRIFGRKKIKQPNLSQIDGYVLLSEYMRIPLKIHDRPFMVMEGIYSVAQETFTNENVTNEEFGLTKPYILYTGALDERNGIFNLLSAFNKIPNKDIELVLCGDGEAKNIIKEQAKIDPRIKYLGQVTHKVALQLQRNAYLLINPRRATEDFAKYSFPSKTLEYLASGTPLVMYKLESLPDEYLKHIHIPKDESVEALTEIIVELLTKKREITQQKEEGKSREFIIKQKSSLKQVSRIIEFAEQLYMDKYKTRY